MHLGKVGHGNGIEGSQELENVLSHFHMAGHGITERQIGAEEMC